MAGFFMLYIYFVLLLSVIFIRDSTVIDLIGVQWLYLSIVNFLALLYNFYRKNSLPVISHWLKVSIYLLFIILFLSTFQSIVIKLSLIDIARYFVIYLTVYNTLLLIDESKFNFLKIARIFLIFLVFDNIEFLISYYKNFSSLTPRSTVLKGFTSNINITAFAILLKTPFLLYLILKDIKWIRLISYISLVISLICLFWIQSRASYIALLLIIVTLLLSFKSFPKVFLKFFSIAILSFILANFHISKNNKNQDNFKRISSIINLDQKDVSINNRLRYYEAGFNQILKSPFIGVGIGNWKINSVEYDRKYMENYTVPYHMHNDFLQIFAETGIIGFILYFGIFAYLTLILVHKLINKKLKFQHLILLMCLTTYIVDANFNFPHERSEIQAIFPIIIGLILYFEKD